MQVDAALMIGYERMKKHAAKHGKLMIHKWVHTLILSPIEGPVLAQVRS
jgi:hypothetical protein